MQSIIKAIIFGFLTWLIPFAVSIPFYGPGGVLLVSDTTFKTIMIVVGALVGAFLLYQYFKNVHTHYIKEGIIIGIIWFGMSIILDLMILVPMAKISMRTYFLSIGLRYLIIPIMSMLVATLLRAQSVGIKAT